MFTELREFIRKYDRFVVTTHFNPDCDALGSSIGMAEIIRACGKPARIISNDPTPKRFEFVDPEQTIQVFSEDNVPAIDEAMVVVDAADLHRLGRFGRYLLEHPRPMACVDHHRSNAGFAEINLIDPDACATGFMLGQIANAWQIPLLNPLASALYIAIYTDTGGFRFPNTNAETLALAAELVRGGANPSYLASEFHENIPIGRVQLFSEVLNNLHMELNGKLVWIAISQSDMDRYQCDRSDVEGFVEYVRGIESVEVAVLFREVTSDKTKISLRSREYVDCCSLAEQLGGGGHYHAAGVDISMPMETAIEQALPTIRAGFEQTPSPSKSCRHS